MVSRACVGRRSRTRVAELLIEPTVIHQMAPWIGVEERTAVDQYLASGGWLTEFKKTEEFAQLVAEYVGSEHCFILANGTLTLFAALSALDLGAGDEVIVPDFTMIASANAVVLAGARPVFVDISLTNLCLDLDLVEEAITPQTKGIMLVSLNGRAPDLARATELAARHGLFIVEDAAQSLGSRQHDKHLGTFGQIGSFSFSAQKVITTGQGGALVTNDPRLAERIRQVKDFGRRCGGNDFYESIGFNFKFTDLQAVIGIEQMKKLDWRVARKKEMFALYKNELADTEEIRFIDTNLADTSPWFVDVFIPDPIALQDHLAQQGINARSVYPALHNQPAYQLAGHYPNSEDAAAHGLWLPSSSFLEDEEIVDICSEIRDFYGQ